MRLHVEPTRRRGARGRARLRVIVAGGALLLGVVLAIRGDKAEPLRERSADYVYSPAFSPDGRTLAVQWVREDGSGLDLELITVADGGAVASATQPWQPFPWGNPLRDNTMSPDGSRILVQRRLPVSQQPEGTTGHRLMAYDVSEEKWHVVLADADINSIDTPWSPEGERLLATCYSHDPEGWLPVLTILDLKGAVRHPLLKRPGRPFGSTGWAARWSPDGQSVHALDQEWRIVTLAPGRKPVKSKYVIEDPHIARFSPDCHRIAWIRKPQSGTQDELWVLDLATGRKTRLLSPAQLKAESVGPWFAWSPDGDFIATIAHRPVGDSLCVVDTETGDARERGWGGTWVFTDVAWSPDGQQLAIVGGEGTTAKDFHSAVWVVEPPQ